MGNEQTKLRPSTPRKAVGTGWNRIFRFGSSHLRWRTCIPRMHRFSLCRNSGVGFAGERLSSAHNFRFLACIRRPDRTFSIAVACCARRVRRSSLSLENNYSIIEVQGHLTFSQVKVIEDLVKVNELLVKVIEDLFKVIWRQVKVIESNSYRILYRIFEPDSSSYRHQSIVKDLARVSWRWVVIWHWGHRIFEHRIE